MKKVYSLLLFVMVSLVLKGQEPAWLNANQRSEKFPEQIYFTGFAYMEVGQTDTQLSAMQKVKNDARADLSKKIRVRITASTKNAMAAQTVNGQYDEREFFSNESATSTDTEVAGIKIESYYNPQAKLAYAFAYVERDGLSNYYSANLEKLIQQAEGFLHTAIRLEQDGEKVKARHECEQIPAVLAKIPYIQDLLVAIDGNGNLQQDRVEAIRNQSIQTQARLAQGVYMYVQSTETLFGQVRHALGNRIKAQLAGNGCSFVDDPAQADYTLQLNASTRVSSTVDDIVFCYADVVVELYDTHKQKVIFSDEVSQKGGSLTREKAGSMALDGAIPQIVERLRYSIK